MIDGSRRSMYRFDANLEVQILCFLLATSFVDYRKFVYFLFDSQCAQLPTKWVIGKAHVPIPLF